MNTWLFVFVVFSVAYGDDTCPNFPPWRDWSTCLWLPVREMRENILNACDMNLDIDQLPPLPALEGLPTAKCGHCSLKMRCRTRPETEGCFRMDLEKQTCHEHGEVCTFPKIDDVYTFPKIGCDYHVIKGYLKQCFARPDLPAWKREGFKKFDIMGEMNCNEHDGQCKCCCHPYKPSADGSTCEEQTPPQCEPFGEWNDWSSCLWPPLTTLQEEISAHCGIDEWKKQKKMLSKLRLPGGIRMPDQCGYCSAKLKCRKRPFEDVNGKKLCFPLDAEKKTCGPEDCPTCGDVCTLPKVLDTCNYADTARKVGGPKIKAVLKKLPYAMTHAMTPILALMPVPECVEKDGECKCCCHPYKPSADGTSCELNPICQTAEERGIDIEWNVSEKDTFFF